MRIENEQDREHYAALVRLVQRVNGELRSMELVQRETPREVYDAMYRIITPLADWLIGTPSYPGRPEPRQVGVHTPGWGVR